MVLQGHACHTVQWRDTVLCKGTHYTAHLMAWTTHSPQPLQGWTVLMQGMQSENKWQGDTSSRVGDQYGERCWIKKAENTNSEAKNRGCLNTTLTQCHDAVQRQPDSRQGGHTGRWLGWKEASWIQGPQHMLHFESQSRRAGSDLQRPSSQTPCVQQDHPYPTHPG